MDQANWEQAYSKTRRNLKVRERRIRLFRINRSRSILDYGCGDGLDLRVFRSLGYENLYGLDNSRSLLTGATGFARIEADGYNAPLASHSLDVVFVNSVLHHLADVKAALREIKRILKPGGAMCLIEPADSLIRWIADIVTLSPLSRFSPFLKHRRQTLIEERDMQLNWLRSERTFHSLLREEKFEIVLRKRTALNVFLKCRSK